MNFLGSLVDLIVRLLEGSLLDGDTIERSES